MNNKTKKFEEMSSPLWVCCTPELHKFSLEEMLRLDPLFRSLLSSRDCDLLDAEAMLISIAKSITNLKEIELILDSRDGEAYKTISEYMTNMIEACAELCHSIEATTA